VTLADYLKLSGESRGTIDAPIALCDPARRLAQRLREGAKRVKLLNEGVASDMREAANWLVGDEGA